MAPNPTSYSKVTNSIPISPPVPQRRAPRPPHYTPRRSRLRHINMREPARMGLFTVSEVDEGFPTSGYNSAAEGGLCPPDFSASTPSASSSSECLPSSDDGEFDFPRDVESESDVESSVDSTTLRSIAFKDDVSMSNHGRTDIHRISWTSNESTSGSDFGEARTPIMDEDEDVFGFEFMLGLGLNPESSIAFDDDEEMEPSHTNQPEVDTLPVVHRRGPGMVRRGQRPPPLSFIPQYKPHPYRASSSPISPEAPTPRSRSTGGTLLPSVEIVSPTQWRRQTSSAHSPSTPKFDGRLPTSAPATTASMAAKILAKGHRRRRSSDRPVKLKPPQSPDDPVDLVLALQDLLSSCGERIDCDISDFSSSSDNEDYSRNRSRICQYQASQLPFPLPPCRLPPTPASLTVPSGFTTPLSATFETIQTPRTPPQFHQSQQAAPALPSRRRSSDPREEMSYRLKGDHSFLQSLSSGADHASSRGPSSASSSSWSSGSKTSSRSSVSGRSLPRRKELPENWLTTGLAL